MKKLFIVLIIGLVFTSCDDIPLRKEVTTDDKISYKILYDLRDSANIKTLNYIDSYEYYYIVEGDEITEKLKVVKDGGELFWVLPLVTGFFMLGIGIGALISH